jgi:hypothetical protein
VGNAPEAEPFDTDAAYASRNDRSGGVWAYLGDLDRHAFDGGEASDMVEQINPVCHPIQQRMLAG